MEHWLKCDLTLQHEEHRLALWSLTNVQKPHDQLKWSSKDLTCLSSMTGVDANEVCSMDFLILHF